MRVSDRAGSLLFCLLPALLTGAVIAAGCASQKISGDSSLRSPSSIDDVPVFVKGGGADSFSTPPTNQIPIQDPDRYDVVIMGGGLAGLSAATYLTDAGKKVLILEKEAQLGGLASWSESADHMRVDRGAAYWTDTFEEELEILKHIGLGDFKKERAIPDPIDSYYVRGKFYKDIWARETVEILPASFALFKYELQRANSNNLIPNQPFEEFEKYGGKMTLDNFNTRAWMEQMPVELAKYLKKEVDDEDDGAVKMHAEGVKILARFKKEAAAHALLGKTGMEDVIELMDLYCRSALGTTSDQISAMAFANFYISEIETRYTSTQGTGVAAENMYKILLQRPTLFHFLPLATVGKMQTSNNGVDVTYSVGGLKHVVHGDYAVFAAQLKLAPDVIEDFKKKSPKQAQYMSELGYSHYSVHLLYVEGQPFRSSYDTWIHARDYSENDFTDMILGQWMDPQMPGYEGYRDFNKAPPIADGVLSIYQPLSQAWLKRGYSGNTEKDEAEVKAMARGSAQRLENLFGMLPPELWKGPLKIKQIETSRWPLSVHIARPGHYSLRARTLRKHFGRIFFAHNNMGTPAFEEALFRGHCAASNILVRSVKSYRFEKWSHCPPEL